MDLKLSRKWLVIEKNDGAPGAQAVPHFNDNDNISNPKITSPSLLKLPDELLLEIMDVFENPTKNHYLRSLALTNRRLRDIAQNILLKDPWLNIHNTPRFVWLLLIKPHLAQSLSSINLIVGGDSGAKLSGMLDLPKGVGLLSKCQNALVTIVPDGKSRASLYHGLVVGLNGAYLAMLLLLTPILKSVGLSSRLAGGVKEHFSSRRPEIITNTQSFSSIVQQNLETLTIFDDEQRLMHRQMHHQISIHSFPTSISGIDLCIMPALKHLVVPMFAFSHKLYEDEQDPEGHSYDPPVYRMHRTTLYFNTLPPNLETLRILHGGVYTMGVVRELACKKRQYPKLRRIVAEFPELEEAYAGYLLPTLSKTTEECEKGDVTFRAIFPVQGNTTNEFAHNERARRMIKDEYCEMDSEWVERWQTLQE
ncbi:hypothetical protein P154DRAFT_519652 [Amniculicola lignicola CBS 123094]|uniref:F-box domain-containing protein n=1 Tax=Amniculicola lignicola CBS 123094 TaxID=1392246 RepID=A0A6A5WV87_9PLEO|nr:hypothetical protein P154DRAFT_519652 [Amniculicola lignicola CBS 123094]